MASFGRCYCTVDLFSVIVLLVFDRFETDWVRDDIAYLGDIADTLQFFDILQYQRVAFHSYSVYFCARGVFGLGDQACG